MHRQARLRSLDFEYIVITKISYKEVRLRECQWPEEKMDLMKVEPWIPATGIL